MENNTPFDLKSAVRQWRENLAHAPGFSAENIEELETHLHDAMRDLQGRGLFEEEAFAIAVRRLGSAPLLANEFARVNGAAVWTDRMLWMLCGWAFFSTVRSFLFSISLVSFLPYTLTGVLLAFTWIAPVVMAFVVVRSLGRARGNPNRPARFLSGSSAGIAAAVFLLGVFPLVFNSLVMGLATQRWLGFLSNLALGHGAGGRVLAVSASSSLASMVEWAIVSALVFLLARKRLGPAELNFELHERHSLGNDGQ